MKIPVILAGGSGSRLWPLSTPENPKPFLSLDGVDSLLCATVRRALPLQSATAQPLIISSTALASRVLHEISHITQIDIIAEPHGRNTGPAVLAAACLLQQRYDNAVMMVFPSDHWVEAGSEFKRTLKLACAVAADGMLVTIGVSPTHPSADYGYIKTGESMGHALRVERFFEKPDTDTAAQWIAEGAVWNSGIFAFDVQTLLQEAQRLCPDTLLRCREAVAQGSAAHTIQILHEPSWLACASIPIDRLIIEKTAQAAMVPATFGWSDVGTMESWKRYATKP